MSGSPSHCVQSGMCVFVGMDYRSLKLDAPWCLWVHVVDTCILSLSHSFGCPHHGSFWSLPPQGFEESFSGSDCTNERLLGFRRGHSL